jgi:hypothetical protein
MYQALAILGPTLAELLKLYDMATNFPSGLHLNSVYRSQRLATGLRNQSSQLAKQTAEIRKIAVSQISHRIYFGGQLPTFSLYLNTVSERIVIVLSTIRGIRCAMSSEFATPCVALVWPICW